MGDGEEAAATLQSRKQQRDFLEHKVRSPQKGERAAEGWRGGGPGERSSGHAADGAVGVSICVMCGGLCSNQPAGTPHPSQAVTRG